MKDEGNTARARENFILHPSSNIKVLLSNRYTWMNKFIGQNDKGIEVGCGTGVSKQFINNQNLLLTDFNTNPWLDLQNIDALKTPFKRNSFDFVISSNMIHHLSFPSRFINEMERILKPGGLLLIQEVNNSFFMRFFLRLMKHEGYSYDVNVFSDKLCTEDLWSANCATPNLMFDQKEKFCRNFPNFSIIQDIPDEFFIFLNSGGVISKTFYVPMPEFLLRIMSWTDRALARILPSIFALQRQIVLQKRK